MRSLFVFALIVFRSAFAELDERLPFVMSPSALISFVPSWNFLRTLAVRSRRRLRRCSCFAVCETSDNACRSSALVQGCELRSLSLNFKSKACPSFLVFVRIDGILFQTRFVCFVAVFGAVLVSLFAKLPTTLAVRRLSFKAANSVRFP